MQPAVHEASSTACSETGSVTEHRVARKMSAPGRMKRASTRVREREGKRGTRKKKVKVELFVKVQLSSFVIE